MTFLKVIYRWYCITYIVYLEFMKVFWDLTKWGILSFRIVKYTQDNILIGISDWSFFQLIVNLLRLSVNILDLIQPEIITLVAIRSSVLIQWNIFFVISAMETWRPIYILRLLHAQVLSWTETYFASLLKIHLENI